MANFHFKLKASSKKEVVGFNNSGAPLGERDDLHILVEQIVEANDTELKKHFDELPTLEEIKRGKGEAFLENNPAPATVPQTDEPREAVETGNPAVPVITPEVGEKPAPSKPKRSKAAEDAE